MKTWYCTNSILRHFHGYHFHHAKVVLHDACCYCERPFQECGAGWDSLCCHPWIMQRVTIYRWPRQGTGSQMDKPGSPWQGNHCNSVTYDRPREWPNAGHSHILQTTFLRQYGWLHQKGTCHSGPSPIDPEKWQKGSNSGCSQTVAALLHHKHYKIVRFQ